MAEGQGCSSSTVNKASPHQSNLDKVEALVEEPWYLPVADYFITSPLTSHISTEPTDILYLAYLRPTLVNQTSQDINYRPFSTSLCPSDPLSSGISNYVQQLMNIKVQMLLIANLLFPQPS